MVAETFLAMGPNEVGMYALAATRTWLYVFGISLTAATWHEPPLPKGEGTHAPDAMTSPFLEKTIPTSRGSKPSIGCGRSSRSGGARG